MFQPNPLRGELCGDLRKGTLRGPDFRHEYQAAPANAFFYRFSSPRCGPNVRSVRPMSPSAVCHERAARPTAKPESLFSGSTMPSGFFLKKKSPRTPLSKARLLWFRSSAGETGTLPRPTAGELCAVRRNVSLKSKLQSPRQYAYRYPLRACRLAPRAPEECVLYPRTELMQSKACSAGIAARRAGFGGRNDAECRQ